MSAGVQVEHLEIGRLWTARTRATRSSSGPERWPDGLDARRGRRSRRVRAGELDERLSARNVQGHPDRHWSPEQISRTLCREFPDRPLQVDIPTPEMCVSRRTIYQALSASAEAQLHPQCKARVLRTESVRRQPRRWPAPRSPWLRGGPRAEASPDAERAPERLLLGVKAVFLPRRRPMADSSRTTGRGNGPALL
jgi:hypothetical protein